jgi:lipoyl(octanoyl) transferase
MSTVLEHTRIVQLGLVLYDTALKSMRDFNAKRDKSTPDELWLLEHPPVYTLGIGADPAHGPRLASDIPVVETERGGEITYHGPGQLVVYTMVDLARRDLRVKRFVWLLEQAVIDLLGGLGERRPGAPGIYVEGAKIAALGIRVSRGCAYHGLSLNVDMDLAPFAAIDPCGYPRLEVTQVRNLGLDLSIESAGMRLADLLAEKLDHA